MNTFATQQTNETIHSNIQNWTALHTVSHDKGEENRKIYEAEKMKKFKIRMIEAFRAKREA